MSIDKFKNRSHSHTVEWNGVNFIIRPISESNADLVNFQHLAKQASRYDGNDYTVTPHYNCDEAENVKCLDAVAFIKCEHD
ncbi:hypothetical protein P0W48_15920 [Plesiomonas shigelloides]|uniref:hypothetical protein n=1 Tax=Plesiomonas shigelloides TaxID=703 RepID=UPI001057EEC6|nr:hypothetical protein [Plesiomonas shigelloides]